MLRVIFYDQNNRQRRYFPDFFIEEKYIEEVKYNHDLKSEISKIKYIAGYNHAKENNFMYYAVTEKSINKLPEEIYNDIYNKEIREELNLF